MAEARPRPADPLRVVVVDADDRMRESLCGLLSIGDHVVVVGAAGRPDAAIDLALEARPDLVVVDPRLPELDAGIAFIRDLRARWPAARVLVLAGSGAAERTAIGGDADAYLRKTLRPSELVAAIAAACADQ